MTRQSDSQAGHPERHRSRGETESNIPTLIAMLASVSDVGAGEGCEGVNLSLCGTLVPRRVLITRSTISRCAFASCTSFGIDASAHSPTSLRSFLFSRLPIAMMRRVMPASNVCPTEPRQPARTPLMHEGLSRDFLMNVAARAFSLPPHSVGW